MKKLLFKQAKKAQIFTVLSILLILLMFVSFEVFSLLRSRQAIQTRVSSMEGFLGSIEDNLERQIYISGFRILFLADAHITKTGSYINVDDFFGEAFFNGTVGGENESLLYMTTYNDMLTSINNKASKINVIVNMTNPVISIEQEDPWSVKVTLTSDFVMNDVSGLASWNRTQNISAYIPVEGFEDPLYIIGSSSKVTRKINRTIYEGEYTPIANLYSHAELGLYAENSDAPSFLNRLEGNLSASPYGIETFVNVAELKAQGIAVSETVSVVDHTYFGTRVPGSSVGGMQSWFRIDDGHRAKYQI